MIGNEEFCRLVEEGQALAEELGLRELGARQRHLLLLPITEGQWLVSILAYAAVAKMESPSAVIEEMQRFCAREHAAQQDPAVAALAQILDISYEMAHGVHDAEMAGWSVKKVLKTLRSGTPWPPPHFEPATAD